MKKVQNFSGAKFSVEMKSYFLQHEIIHQSPSDDWHDSLLIGNGDIGVLVYEPGFYEWGITKVDVRDNRFDREKRFLKHETVVKLVKSKNWEELERIHKLEHDFYIEGLSENSVYNHHPTPKPCGNLRIRFKEGKKNPFSFFEKRLSLYKGEVTTIANSEARKETIISAVDANTNILAVNYNGRFLKKEEIFIELVRHKDPSLGAPFFFADNKNIWVEYRFPDGFCYVMMATILDKGEYTTEIDENLCRIKVSPGDRKNFTILLTVGTSLEDKNPLRIALKNIETARTKGYGAIRREHRKWWHNFWSKSFISLSDKFVENVWYYHLYIMASCSRGNQPPPLFFWHLDDYQPWHGDYHTNVNIEMVYYPIFTSNHLELGAPFYKHFFEILPIVKEETEEVFGINGAKYPFCSVGTGKEISGGYWCYEIYVTAWVAQLFWWHFLYSQDKDFLATKGYKVMREVMRFYEGYLTLDENGKYSVFPCHLVEQMGDEENDKWQKNGTCEIAFLKELLKGVIKASEILNVDNDAREKWKHILENISPYPTDGKVFLEYEGAPSDLLVHHPDVLSPIFPCGEIGVHSKKEMYRMAKRTLTELPKKCKRATTTFIPYLMRAWGWAICAGMRLGFGGEWARKYLCDSSILGLQNGFGLSVSGERPKAKRYAPEVVGVNLQINEMLLQSYDGIIRVFPAVPRDWTCKIGNLRAVGAFLVSGEIEKGKVKYITIKSEAGMQCKLLNPWKESKVIVRDAERKDNLLIEKGKKIIEFPTEVGKIYILSEGKHNSSISSVVTLTGKKRKTPRVYCGPKYFKTNINKKICIYMGKPGKI